MTSFELSTRFCGLPFEFAEIHWTGDVFLCCPAWNGSRSIGNVFTDEPSALWNSLAARQIRSGVLDGSFSHCSHEACPLIVSGNLPSRSEASGDVKEIISNNVTWLRKGPSHLKLCHDDTCNLSCPSCRSRVITADTQRQAKLDKMFREFILPFAKDAKMLTLSGDGDPFASRHYRDIMRGTAQSNPSMKIGLHTNGVLCDAKSWTDCLLWGRVERVDVSIDAAAAATYSIVRRGGDFERLLENLRFLSGLRASSEIGYLQLSFVVQSINFREMNDFVKLGQMYNVDRVYFSLIRHWSRSMVSDVEFENLEIHRDSHPLNGEFRERLRHSIFDDPIVMLGDLAKVRKVL